jgi:hypothetical protein
MTDLFTSARLKIERADKHISDLEKKLSVFTRQTLDASVCYRDEATTDITLTAIAPPPSFALLIGDAIHNLWSALDHLTWELVGLDGGCQHSRLYFPTGRDRAYYNKRCREITTPSANVKQLFESLEAFPDGVGHLLYVAHRLDNADKHRILTPVVNAPSIDELVLVSDEGKIIRPLSHLYGGNSVLCQGETFTIDGAHVGTRLAFKDDAQISPHILFGNVEFVQNRPVFSTILQIRQAVSNAIEIAARAIS